MIFRAESHLAPGWKVAKPRVQGGKKGGFSIYLLRIKLLRDYVTKRLETRTKLLGD